jgi:hypothetical protein
MLATGKWDCIRAAVVVTTIGYCLLACSGRQLQLDVASLPPLAVAGASLTAEQQLALVAVEDPLPRTRISIALSIPMSIAMLAPRTRSVT